MILPGLSAHGHVCHGTLTGQILALSCIALTDILCSLAGASITILPECRILGVGGNLNILYSFTQNIDTREDRE